MKSGQIRPLKMSRWRLSRTTRAAVDRDRVGAAFEAVLDEDRQRRHVVGVRVRDQDVLDLRLLLGRAVEPEAAGVDRQGVIDQIGDRDIDSGQRRPVTSRMGSA